MKTKLKYLAVVTISTLTLGHTETPQSASEDYSHDSEYAQLLDKGRVSRGWLGVSTQDVTRELAELFGMKKSMGALVAKVFADSPAAKAGFEAGDVIVSYNGNEVAFSSDLTPMVGTTAIGKKVPVEIIRRGQQKTLKVLIAELPERIKKLAAWEKAPQQNNANTLDLTVFEKNPLFKAEYKQELEQELESNRMTSRMMRKWAKFWIKFKTKKYERHTGYLRPYLGIQVNNRYRDHEYNDAITISDFSNLTEKKWFKKILHLDHMSSQTGESDGAHVRFKIDDTGKPHSFHITSKSKWYSVNRKVVSDLMSAITFQPIYGKFSDNPEEIYKVTVFLYWSIIEPISKMEKQEETYGWHVAGEMIRVEADGTVNILATLGWHLAGEMIRVEDLLSEHQYNLAKIAKEKEEKARLAREEKARKARLAKKERERKAKIAKAEQARKEKQTKEKKAREEFLAQQEKERNDIFDKFRKNQNDVIVLSKPESGNHSFESTDDFYDQLNRKYHKSINLSDNQKAFPPPTKGEFEKSDTYEARLTEEKAKHEKFLLEKQEELYSRKTQIIEELLGNFIGKPSLKSVIYDADKEEFEVNINYSSKLTFNASTPHPIDSAPQIKKEIEASNIWAVFTLNNDEVLKLESFVLQSKNSTIEALPKTNISVALSRDRFQKYEVQLAQEEAAEKIRNKKALAEWHKQQAERRKLWPTGAIAEVHKGAVICTTLKGAFRARAIENNPYVTQARDCSISPATEYASSFQHMNGGISRVTLVGAYLDGFTSSHNISE